MERDFSKGLIFNTLVKDRHTRASGYPETNEQLEKTGFPFSWE
jgi:hypothetical protein